MAEETPQNFIDFIRSMEPRDCKLQEVLHQVTAEGPRRYIHVVVSTGSGSGGAEKFYKNNIPNLFSKLGVSAPDGFITHLTQSADTVSELTRDVFAPQALQGKQILIVILSGDGGIVDLVNGLAPHAHRDGYAPPYVAALPFGTANALAHSTNIASDATFGLRSLCHGSPRNLPVFRVRFSPGSRLLVDEARRKEELPLSLDGIPPHPATGMSNSITTPAERQAPELHCSVVCSWGFHAAIVADSDTAELRKHGIDRFKMAAQEALNPANGKGPHQYAGDVYYLKGAVWTKVARERHGYVLATSVSNLEEKFMISPASKAMDGSMRLVHFGPLLGDNVMRIMMQAYAGGKHVEDEAVGYEEIDGLWIDFKENGDENDDGERWRRVCVDGKIVAVEKGGWISVRKDASRILQLIVPSS